jgi:hypothetical protein
MSAAVPREVSVRTSNIDSETLFSTAVTQPSLYAAILNCVMVFVSQKAPDSFFPIHYINRRYNGVRAYRLLMVPFTICGIGYVVVANMATTEHHLRAHLLGFGLSMFTGVGFLMMRRLSWLYNLMAGCYFTFAFVHHYRYLKIYSNNAPLYMMGDATEIFNDYRRVRIDKEQVRTHRRQLAAEQKLH